MVLRINKLVARRTPGGAGICRHKWVFSVTSVSLWLILSADALSSPPPVMLQYFEAKWDVIRPRMPDVFMAGYDSIWVPPPQKGAAGVSSIGYDLFDRFDLGSTSAQTRYGTENTFRLMVNEAHHANCRVFVDWLMNHNATQDNNTPNFITQGGYPGFVLVNGGDQYGDFNTYDAGCPQSTSPCCGFSLSDPQCPGCCYHLYNGRLLGLIDIDPSKNHNFIRHPVTPGDPNNIPAGTIYNIPTAANRRFYPDQALGAIPITMNGTSRNPGTLNYTFYPYNNSDPSQGDPVIENAAALLMRASQYYLDVLKVDGFRLDAAKHMPTWFWDNLWDASVYNRYTAFDGTTQTPYSFSEAVESNSNMANWVRKPGESGSGYPAIGWQQGNRDALDLNEAGALRDLVENDGSGSWDNIISSSVDNVDGFNNGTIGVHHVCSHDNAISTGENDTVAFAYVLMRTGPACVYHMANQFGPPPNNFPRRNGRDDALGLGDNYITRLVTIRNEYARGFFIPVTISNQQGDVLVFTRRTPNSVDNVLVGVNDLETNGFDIRSVTTTFPQGTRLQELTGNAANATVDPNNNIAEVLTVGAGGSVSINVPRNRNANGVFHGRGYVIYGPAVPSGTLSITNASTTIVPPDSAGIADHLQRISPITIVNSDTFDIQLQTTQTDVLDPNTDDLAVFRIDQGFQDYNNDGSTYLGQPNSDFHPGNTNSDSPSYGFENFITQNSPRCMPDGGGVCQNTGTGTYRQTIDAAALGDGYHYITARAYRHRTTGDPLFAEFRIVIYVDREDPDFVLLAPPNTCNNDVTSLPVDWTVKANDGSTGKVYVFVDFPAGTDFVSLASGPSNLATQLLDVFTFRQSSLSSGNHRADIVAIETLPNATTRYRLRSYAGVQSTTGAGLGAGDLNADAVIDGRDTQSFIYYVTGINPNFGPAADVNCDGLNDLNDIPGFVSLLLGP
jgi:hypothetical protein